MNCKAKGNRRERQTRALLEDAGYSVTKAGASLGVFDLIAIGADNIILVQVKSNRWPGSEELAEIRAFVCPVAVCIKRVYRWRDGCTEPDVMNVDDRMERAA